MDASYPASTKWSLKLVHTFRFMSLSKERSTMSNYEGIQIALLWATFLNAKHLVETLFNIFQVNREQIFVGTLT